MRDVKIGVVSTFTNVNHDKAQVVKISEETNEIYSAWEKWRDSPEMAKKLGDDSYMSKCLTALIDECCDAIQAISNFLAAIGVSDLTEAMERCTKRNHDRGRL